MPTDRQFLLDLYAETRSAELAVTGWTDDQRRHFITMQFDAQDTDYRMRHPSASFDVVLLHGDPIGRLYVDRRLDTVHLIDITISAALQRRGIGTALLVQLQDEARATARSITLFADVSNPARAWYERLGFATVRLQGVHVFMSWRAA